MGRGRVRVGLAVACLAALLAPVQVGAVNAEPGGFGTPPPSVSDLRIGSPPTVGYALGTRLYYPAGPAVRSVDLAAVRDSVRPSEQLHRVVTSRGITYTQFDGFGADIIHHVGRVSATLPWRRIRTTTGAAQVFDVSTGGLVATPSVVSAVRPSGATYADLPALPTRSGLPISNDQAEAVGVRFVVHQHDVDGVPGGVTSYLWHPDHRPARLPDGTVGVGRLGRGWLGIPAPGEDLASGVRCWRTAPADAPRVVREPTLCSATRPLLSPDGRYAVLVSLGRMVVRDAVTGRVVSTAALAPLHARVDGTRFVVPATWESDRVYLATARDGARIALVRCRVATGACEAAVRSTASAGRAWVVTERDPWIP